MISNRPSQNRKPLMTRLPSVLLLTAIAAATPVTAEETFPLTAKRILFLGDSITNSGYYVAEIETQLRLQSTAQLPEIINIGLPSETCTGLSEPDHPFPRPDVHERLDRALGKIKPDVVVACYGMNDGIYYPFSDERFSAYKAGIRKLTEKVHASGAKLILITPPPFDPTPLKSRDGKLLPAGAEKYAWFAIYENYDRDVISRYARWIMTQGEDADMVIDVHTPLSEFLAEKRKKDPTFHVANDGVHMNETGHREMATAILKAWGIESWEEPSKQLRQLAKQREHILHDAWLSHVGHKRPGVKEGLALNEANAKAAALQTQIDALVDKAKQPSAATRTSTGGTVYSIHYPASLEKDKLRLYVDYDLWIPDGVATIQGIIVHQHGCGPGASIGGQTTADDMHWQALARKQDCALMGSSYEPRKGINCRLWCDARQGSAVQFLRALEHFSAATGHNEIGSIPWCLWGHSGGGFWASLMQTMYPERIVAIWLQSGTAFGYWTKGDIESPQLSAAAYGVPVMANPGLKEKDHERFHVAYDGSKAMQQEYQARGAVFFEFAADPGTSHECGDSRYLSIPFFDFWLTHRLSNNSSELQPVGEVAIKAWGNCMAGLQAEFVQTGAVDDTTPPPSPSKVWAKRQIDGSVLVKWKADADVESGVGGFAVLRDGNVLALLPENPVRRFGRPLFQTMSYHDTPERPLPRMEFVDRTAPPDQLPAYSVRTINSVGLQSEATLSP